MVNRYPARGGTNWGGSFLQHKGPATAHPAPNVIEEKQQPAQAANEKGAAAAMPPKLIPATPVPFEPYSKVYNFPITANENGTKTIWINNHRVTIPDLNILAAVPKK
ncbi:hypothetical protein [Terribacillus saccharophilus]|uniref:hypothetical protein n=1 Tax=Terribacillus saccharophilus TaxID=361277 RepID=UPI003982590E